MIQYLTPPAVARRLGICERTFYRWLAADEIPPPDASLGSYRGYSAEAVSEIEEWFHGKTSRRRE